MSKTNKYIIEKEAQMKPYSAYLFDADGTILDTADLIKKSFRHTIETHDGRTQSDEEIMSRVGLPFLTQIESYFDDLTEEKKHKIWEVHREYQFSLLDDYLKEAPGTTEALSELKNRGAALAIVTSRNRRTLDIYLKKLNLFDYFDIIITPENVENAKPHPEPCYKALETIKVDAKDALFIGDAVYDSLSAVNAEVDFAYVNWSHIPVKEFNPQPKYFLDSMTDLL